jgi:hypothetical protein
MERIGGRLGAAYTLDKEWVDATDKRAAQVRSRAASPRATLLTNLLRLSRPLLTPARGGRRWSDWTASSTPTGGPW